MQFGVCTGAAVAAVAAKAGFDFIESTVGALLRPGDDEPRFQQSLAEFQAAPLPCPVVNCFIPRDLRITGADVNLAALETYADTAFARASRAGVKIIVLGSGGARQVPDGFPRVRAYEQFIEFCCRAAPLAAARGVTVVIEPLNRNECNILNTVAECADVVRAVADPAVRLLVDGYHWAKDGDAAADIVRHGDLLRHVHIATTQNRLPPGAEPCDFTPFFAALREAGYDGRVSIEAKIASPETQLPAALQVLRDLA